MQLKLWIKQILTELKFSPFLTLVLTLEILGVLIVTERIPSRNTFKLSRMFKRSQNRGYKLNRTLAFRENQVFLTLVKIGKFWRRHYDRFYGLRKCFLYKFRRQSTNPYLAEQFVHLYILLNHWICLFFRFFCSLDVS